MPKVSVIMSVYNCEKYVKHAVESILAQTFTDFEFIIINDGSTDRTPVILQAYNDPRIRIIQQSNSGLTKSLNRGIRLAQGEYIARMDGDDVSLPERFEKQVDFLDKNHEVGVVGTAYYEMDHKGRIVGQKIFPTEDKELRRVMIKYNPINHTSAMIRKAVFEKVGLYNETFPRAQDYELWFRVVKCFKIANLPDLLTMRRYDDTNISIAAEQQQIRFGIYARIKAIGEGQYPWYCSIYLFRPLIAMKAPGHLKAWIRKYILKSKKWE
jgi:glycosyltransferase involved in cell wall biosynthesis